MIMPMKKVYLVVQDKRCKEALSELRNLGVMHIEKFNPQSEDISRAVVRMANAEAAMGIIQSYKVPKQKNAQQRGPQGRGPWDRKPTASGRRGRRASDQLGNEETEPYSLDAINAPVRPELMNLILDMDKDRKKLEEKSVQLERERDRIAAWGSFKPDQVRELADKGCKIYLYALPPEAVGNIPKEINYVKLSQDKFNVHLAVLDNEIPGIQPFSLPEKPLDVIEEDLSNVKAKLDALEERIRGFANRQPFLKKDIEKIQTEIDFHEAVATLEQVDGVPSEMGCSCLKGYVLAEDMGRLKRTSVENGWALAAYDPEAEDVPPTKIKSGPVARLIHPLFSFLGTIPGYREFDISPSYLIFFSIFFAMILGDAGYGLLMFVLSTVLGISMKKKNGTFPDVAKLLMMLTFCTIVWGTINGSWFAIPHEHLPAALTALILPPFNATGPVVEFPAFLQYVFKMPAEVPRDEFKSRWYIQFLCFSLAVVQMVYARSKRIKRALPSLTAFDQLGTLVILIGLYFLVLYMLLKIPFPPFALWFIIAGVSLNILFCEQKGGNFFVNIGKGFGGFIQIFLKAVSCFGDIISYLRLFAVGLAGSMVAQIFNSMAVPADGLGSFGIGFLLKIITAVLILAAGHGLNLLLTALSVIVHAVRLNLLEYAGNHLEMEWSGYIYKPFALKQEKK